MHCGSLLIYFLTSFSSIEEMYEHILSDKKYRIIYLYTQYRSDNMERGRLLTLPINTLLIS